MTDWTEGFVSRWQPMKTAPKDGSVITLSCTPDGQFETVQWRDGGWVNLWTGRKMKVNQRREWIPAVQGLIDKYVERGLIPPTKSIW